MITNQEIVLLVGIKKNITLKALSLELGANYKTIYKHIKKLEIKNIIKINKNKELVLSDNQKSKEYFSLIYFCFKNNIDYRKLVTKKSAELIYSFSKKNNLKNYSYSYSKDIISILYKFGFIYIISLKPFKFKLFNSSFLKLLVKYFINKDLDINNFKVLESIDIEKLDNLLNKNFKKYLKSKNNNLLCDPNYTSKQKTKLIFNSLSLEGNTLILPETEKIIKKQIITKDNNISDIEQVLDYKKGIDFLLDPNVDLNLENILEFHKLVANSITKKAGSLRKTNVKIKGNRNFKTKSWEHLPELLNNLFINIKYNLETIKKDDIISIIKFAAYAHNEFQRIHPFEDGNSRTSRAILSKILYIYNLPIIYIPVGLFDVYMDLTKLSKKRDDYLFTLLIKIIVYNNIYNELKKIN
jgi:fido (protein-threonine AMPylation protein)